MTVYGAPCKDPACSGVIFFPDIRHQGEPDPIVFALSEPQTRECPVCHHSHLYSEIGPYEVHSKPHWVNICEREPEINKEVQVLVVRLGTDLGYARAKATESGWDFITDPISAHVVAWLESEHFLNAKELSDVPKDEIRFS